MKQQEKTEDKAQTKVNYIANSTTNDSSIKNCILDNKKKCSQVINIRLSVRLQRHWKINKTSS